MAYNLPFQDVLMLCTIFPLGSVVYKDILLSNGIKFLIRELLFLRKLKRGNTPESIIIGSSMERAIKKFKKLNKKVK